MDEAPPARSAAPLAAPLAPLVPPTPPAFITAMPAQNRGELRPATEAELSLVRKGMPFGAVVYDMLSTDSDVAMRVTTAARTVDVHPVEHEHRIKTVRLEGQTPEGLIRALVTYTEDVAQKVERGQVVSKPSAVSGRSYVVDVGPGGVRVFSKEGYTPSPAEVEIVQKDYAVHRRKRPADEELRRARRDLPLPVVAPIAAVTEQIRRQFEETGMKIHDLQVSVRGVREHDGAPCAVFGVVLRAHRDGKEEGSDVRLAVDLAGDYAVRLADGWDAEMTLEGLRRVSGRGQTKGTPFTFDSVGRLRIVALSRYDLSAVGTHRALESLDRRTSPPPR